MGPLDIFLSFLVFTNIINIIAVVGTVLAGQPKYWIGRKSTADAILLLVTIVYPLDKIKKR